ncbi:MAG: BrnT family toxin [Sphingobacterium sp.]|nr:BrnT family toxin [Sphingobacterium sp.]
MNITFDPAKDRLNRTKHGLSLALAADLEWDLAWVREDARDAYGEQRWVGFAPIGRMIYGVVFTEEQDCYRIISLREATNREKRTYIDLL